MKPEREAVAPVAPPEVIAPVDAAALTDAEISRLSREASLLAKASDAGACCGSCRQPRVGADRPPVED